MSELELTAELLVDGATPTAPVISPDGRWVAYVVTTPGVKQRRVSALWVVPADTSSPPRKLTAGTAWDRLPRWAPDSGSLLFVSDGQLHRIRLDGGAEALTSWRAGIDDHLPIADGRVVAVVARDEPGAEDERREAEGDDAIVWGKDVPRSRLRLLELRNRELRVLDRLGDRHVIDVVQRPDGGPLAVISWACPQDEPGAFTARLHMVDPETGAVQDLGPVGLEARSPAWWPAEGGWHLSYLAMTPPGSSRGRAFFDVCVPAVGVAPEHRNLTAGMDVCPAELAQVADGPPLAMFAEGLDTALYRLDPGAQRFRRVSAWPGRVDSLTVSPAGYAVFLPNPRGSEGRGHEFAAMVEGAVGTDEWTDILSGSTC